MGQNILLLSAAHMSQVFRTDVYVSEKRHKAVSHYFYVSYVPAGVCKKRQPLAVRTGQYQMPTCSKPARPQNNATC